MSCLSPDAVSHFEQREQQLLALSQQLEQRRAQALSGVPGAAHSAEHAPLSRSASRVPPEEEQRSPQGVAAAATHGPEALSTAAGPEAPGNDDAELAPAVAPAPPQLHSAATAAAPGEGPEAVRTTVRLQGARIAALQEELEKTLAELASRDGEVRQLRQEVRQLSEENRKLQKASSPGEQLQERLKRQLSDAEAKVKDLEAERTELLRVKDQFDLQTRKHEAESSTKDARMHRLSEECERYRHALKEANSQDKDRVAADRKETDRLTSEVRKLERQRTELVNAFKKQMKLIDVLKRQRAHMEAARVLSFTEDEFIRILELGDKLGE